MAAGGRDRLSDLPDDLLRRVLHFAPLKEAASTTALSRRWRVRPPLWLSSGAVNLETGVQRSHYSSGPDGRARFFAWREAFDSAAAVALDAAKAPVTRLTMRLGSDLHVPVGDCNAWYHDEDKADKVVSRYTDLVDAVLSLRAARRVQDLRVDAKNPDHYLHGELVGLYTVTLDSLPSETLRVLELINCRGILYHCQRQSPAVVFPRLSSLRLSHSVLNISSLQCVMEASPVLAALHLHGVHIDATPKEEAKEVTTCRLRCPAATVLVLNSCSWKEKKQARERFGLHNTTTVDVDGVEIDAMKLRRFTYNLSFISQPLELERVDLDFVNHGYQGDKNETFWRFARSFTSTKQMRLRMNHLEDMAVLREARRVELLPAFRRLHRLEVHGAYWGKGKNAALAILNLLRSCPVLRTLRINLTAKHEHTSNNTRVPHKEIQIAALLGPHNLIQCLRSSLRRVGLKFQQQESDYLGVKLINFLAENAMVLKEMCIDDGEKMLFKRISSKTEKWNSKRKKLGATAFVVLPLKT